MTPKIDPEFQSLIPKLAHDELAQLESNIVAEGCRDPLVVWKDTLIDGHNRFSICEKHGLSYAVVHRDFATRNDALHWIIMNQFGRRNLHPYDRARLALKLKPVLAAKAKENQGSRNDILEKSPESSPINTRKELAAVAGVSDNTIAKVEYIEKHAPEPVKEAVSKGELSINKAHRHVKAFAESQVDLEPEDQPLVVDATKVKYTPQAKTKREVAPEIIPNIGLGVWATAKNILERIKPNDTEREKALKQALAYIKNRIETNK